MSFDAIISIVGLLAVVTGTYFVLRAYGRAIKSAEPDEARVKRFVETAPLERLNNIKA